MPDAKDRSHHYRRAFFLLLGGVALFRLWFMTTLPLSGDESYHWEWSRHPAFGYYDHPGLTAYVIRLSTWSFGRSTEFTVRLPALLLLSGASALCFFLARAVALASGRARMEAERAGFWGGALILMAPIFAFMSMYMSTDPPLIFFWILTLFLFHQAVEKGHRWLWACAGVSMGLAMLTKFLAFFLPPAFFLFLVVSPKDRVWLRRTGPYLAAVLALLVFSPFIWWNITNDCATFRFNFDYRQKALAFVPRHAPEFLGVQAAALTPGIFLFAVVAVFTAFKTWRERRDRQALLLGLCSAVPLAYFLFESFRQEIGPHWPAAGWVGAFIIMGVHAPGRDSAQTVRRRWWSFSIGLCVVLTAMMHAVAHVPPSWISFVWQYSRNPDRIDTAKHVERFGWPELGTHIETVYADMRQAQGHSGKGVFVACNQYGLASNVAFYTPSQLPTHLWRKRKTCGENYRFWDDWLSMKGMDAIFVSKTERRIQRRLPELRSHFREVSAIEPVPIVVDGDVIRRFSIVRCYEFNGEKPEY